MHTVQLKLRAPRIRNLAPIVAGQRMPRPEDVVHLSHRRLIVRAPVERDNAPEPAVRIPAVTRPVADIVHPVPDVLVVALQAIREVDIESLGRAVAPGVVVGHAGPAEVHPGAVAGGLVGLAPAAGAGAEAAVGVDVGLVVHAVEAVGAVVPMEVVYRPGGDGAAIGGCDGLRKGGGGKGQKAGDEVECGHFEGMVTYVPDRGEEAGGGLIFIYSGSGEIKPGT